jgi:3-oxoacyl-(acyl-carrier-protein) synthase
MAPFAADRDGLVVAEGGACLALERADEVVRRAGRPLATLAGLHTASDGFCPHANEPGGAGFRLAMAGCLAAAGSRPEEVDVVLAAASGERELDRAEHRGLAAVWGPRARILPVTALKSWFGDVGAASALFSLAVAARMFETGIIPPTCSTGDLDPELALNLVRRPTPSRLETVMVNESSWGGLNATLLLRRGGR